MSLKRIIISEVSEDQLVELREIEGDRRFTIVIGIFEAHSIERRVRKIPTGRPLTHDLIVSAVENMGGEVHDIIITELKQSTYFAKMRIKYNEELVEVDCRPSDAIAVAVQADVPIYVSEEVLELACNE